MAVRIYFRGRRAPQDRWRLRRSPLFFSTLRWSHQGNLVLYAAVVLSLRDVSFFRPDLGLSRRSLTYRQNSGSGRNSSSDHPDLTTADCLTGVIYICGWLLTHGAALRIWTLSVVLQKGNYERPRCKNFEFVYDLLPTINLCQRRATTAHVRIYCAYPATRTIGQVLGTEQSIIVGSFPFYLGCRCCPYFCASNSPFLS